MSIKKMTPKQRERVMTLMARKTSIKKTRTVYAANVTTLLEPKKTFRFGPFLTPRAAIEYAEQLPFTVMRVQVIKTIEKV